MCALKSCKALSTHAASNHAPATGQRHAALALLGGDFTRLLELGDAEHTGQGPGGRARHGAVGTRRLGLGQHSNRLLAGRGQASLPPRPLVSHLSECSQPRLPFAGGSPPPPRHIRGWAPAAVLTHVTRGHGSFAIRRSRTRSRALRFRTIEGGGFVQLGADRVARRC